MKKYLILVLLAFSYCSLLDNTTSQSGGMLRSIPSNKIWQEIGSSGLSESQELSTSIIVKNGTTYAGFIDKSDGNKISVKKFNNDTEEWESLGSFGFNITSTEIDLVVNSSTEVYLAFINSSMRNRVSVLKYNGTSWAYVGCSDATPRNVSDISLAVEGSSIYLAYRLPATLKQVGFSRYNNMWDPIDNALLSNGNKEDLSIFIFGGKLFVAYIDLANNNEIVVMKYDGSSWTTSVSPGRASRLSFTLDKVKGTINVAFVRLDGKIILKKSINEGANWDNLATGSSPISMSCMVLAVDDEQPYLVYRDVLNKEVSVITYVNGTWGYLGIQGISQGAANTLSLVVEDGIPYIDYKDEVNNNKVTIKKYDSPSSEEYEWNPVGTAGFSASGTCYTSLAFAEDGTPYIAYRDGGNNSKATVMRYNGTSWGNVGPAGFSGNVIAYASLVINKGVPYIAYMDGAYSGKATVMRYNEDIRGWSSVGNPGFTASTTCHTSLAFDNNDTPYVAYQDYGNSGRASVMRYNGSAWVQVGPAGFSGGSYAFYTSLVIDSNNVPYITYMDSAHSSKARVMKFNGTSWVNVGLVGFSAARADYTSLAIDQNDNLYIAYRDYGHQSKASVMKFDGVAWQYVGIPGFSAGTAYYTSLKIAPNGTPYVGYRDDGNSSKATVMKFNGTEWVNVSTPGFSANTANYLSLAIAPNGTPYVGYQDIGNSYEATVMKLEVVQP